MTHHATVHLEYAYVIVFRRRRDSNGAEQAGVFVSGNLVNDFVVVNHSHQSGFRSSFRFVEVHSVVYYVLMRV
jgi:hypothetical protein